MKIYLAGRMSGLPKFNFPAFDSAAVDLRRKGFDVVSPAELDSPEFRARVMNSTGLEPDLLGEWPEALARDVRLIAASGIKGIILLPEWWRSRGARIEATIGLTCGCIFAEFRPDLNHVNWVARSWILDKMREGFELEEAR